MASAPLLSADGAGSTRDLDPVIFDVDFNEPLVHEAVRAELNARRQGTASTLTRGKVRGGGAKPWRQKGTGRARAGSSRSPIWTGGGTVFGPSPRSYVVKVNRKARRAALRSVLSLHARRGSLALVDPDGFEVPSSKRAAGLLAPWGEPRPTLVVVTDDETVTERSFRNLDRVSVLGVERAGLADLVRAASIVLTPAAVERLGVLAAAPERRTATPSEA